MRQRLGRLKRGRRLRPSDVMLASYPKSGNTWIRFIWANVISLSEMDGRVVDFQLLNGELAAEYDSDSWGRMVPNHLFRFVKTHREYDSGAFGRQLSLYVWRHPGDVAVSYFQFLRARRDGPELTTFSDFLRNPELGLPAWCRHVAGWLPHAHSVARYEDFKQDTIGTLRLVLEELDAAEIDEALLKEAVTRSTFDRVRSLEESTGRPASGEFTRGYRFTRKGGVGEWRETFSAGDFDFLSDELARHGLAGRVEEAYG